MFKVGKLLFSIGFTNIDPYLTQAVAKTGAPNRKKIQISLFNYSTTLEIAIRVTIEENIISERGRVVI